MNWKDKYKKSEETIENTLIIVGLLLTVIEYMAFASMQWFSGENVCTIGEAIFLNCKGLDWRITINYWVILLGLLIGFYKRLLR